MLPASFLFPCLIRTVTNSLTKTEKRCHHKIILPNQQVVECYLIRNEIIFKAIFWSHILNLCPLKQTWLPV